MSKSQPVLPYRVLPVSALRPHSAGWEMTTSNGSVQTLLDGSAVPSWDAKLSFVLRKSFAIDFPIGHLLGLHCDNAAFCLTVVGATASGLVREVLFTSQLPPEYPSAVEILIHPQSQRLAKELRLITGLYLAQPARALDELAPKLIGSRLWETSETFRLEGGAARLPLYQVPFSTVFANQGIADAEFHIEISDDPLCEVENGLTVYLNADCPDFIAAVSQGGSQAERRLWGGIMRRLLISGLLGADFWDGAENESGALRTTVRRWASQIWPGSSVQTLRRFLESDFSLFEAQIDSWLASIDSRTSVQRAKV